MGSKILYPGSEKLILFYKWFLLIFLPCCKKRKAFMKEHAHFFMAMKMLIFIEEKTNALWNDTLQQILNRIQ